MQKRNSILGWVLCAAAATAFLIVGPGAVAVTSQTQPVKGHAPAAAPVTSDQQVADLQQQLIKLLRLSPTLTDVVSIDPSLLADQPYVNRNNPELARFLSAHPEIARNPDFYLFSKLSLNPRDRRDQALRRAVWPDLVPPAPSRNEWQQQYYAYQNTEAAQKERAENFEREKQEYILAALVFLCIFGALLWLIHMFVENRRWNRNLKLQNEVHSRLIDKFTSSEELVAYMETEAGKRFLEGPPLSLGGETTQHTSNPMARMLTPLHVGIVLALLGAGLLMLPRHNAEMGTLVLGVLALMPGIGFILSTAVTWVLARRLGLMPEKPAAGPVASAQAPNTQDRP